MRAIMTDDRLNAARCAWDGDANNSTSRLEVNGTTVARQLMGNPKPVSGNHFFWYSPRWESNIFTFYDYGARITTSADGQSRTGLGVDLFGNPDVGASYLTQSGYRSCPVVPGETIHISVNSRWQIPNGVYLGFRFHNGEQFTTLATQRLIQMPDVPAEEWVSLSRSVVVPENAYFMLGTIRTMYATSWPKDTWFDISKVSVTRGVNASFFSGDTKGEELLSLSLSTNPSQYGLAA